MRETSKRYTDDFKRMIVEVYETGKPIKEICEEYGVTYTSVNKTGLIKLIQSKKNSSKPVIKVAKQHKETSKEDKDEILRLKKENERIALENEILKKLSPYSQGNKICNQVY